jgi:hypothetical protein
MHFYVGCGGIHVAWEQKVCILTRVAEVCVYQGSRKYAILRGLRRYSYSLGVESMHFYVGCGVELLAEQLN